MSDETTAAIRKKCRGANIELVGEIQGAPQSGNVRRRAAPCFFPTQAERGLWHGHGRSAHVRERRSYAATAGPALRSFLPMWGFVCETEQDYLGAIDRVHQIRPTSCREKAFREYHYLRMARDYVAQYEKEIGLHVHGKRALQAHERGKGHTSRSSRFQSTESSALRPAKQIAFAAVHSFKTAADGFSRTPDATSGQRACGQVPGRNRLPRKSSNTLPARFAMLLPGRASGSTKLQPAARYRP